ncbi:uncharacterized protein K441DRAFT_195748 [Cenococcum geophilum 1.58]|uniref:uncharacterized protein n=1 Tax=Cenococcum geophilum 1.58 TaxID=794803 RepID=UPI00358E8402|nr:hypothetical protein K441DRAFT_195748 [Cenococcum geophilum 1.58]
MTPAEWQPSPVLSPWYYDPELDNNARIEAISLHPEQYATPDMQLIRHLGIAERIDVPEEGDDDEDATYAWPSDTKRFDMLSMGQCFTVNEAAAEKAPAEQAERHVTLDLTSAYDLMAQKNIIQNHVSTFRVLKRVIKEVHQGAFDGTHNLSEPQFWQQLYLRLENNWGVQNGTQLQDRFAWILEYVLEGSMPVEALSVKHAMLQIMHGNRKSGPPEDHPFQVYRQSQTAKNFFNPDLASGWLGFYMAREGLAAKVLEWLSKHHDIHINEARLKTHYGILITQVWEEADHLTRLSAPEKPAMESGPDGEEKDDDPNLAVFSIITSAPFSQTLLQQKKKL